MADNTAVRVSPRPDHLLRTGHYSIQVVPPGPAAEPALRLRYRVFAEELGASLPPNAGRDLDEWDAVCDHLVVQDGRTGDVVGTYRILTPGAARRHGRGYGETEFDQTALVPIRDNLVEVGRSCVDPAHRNGAVVGLLWAGLTRYLLLSGYRYLGGCASVPLDDARNAATVVRDALRRHRAPAEHSVAPVVGWEYRELADVARPVVPPLLRAYLRIGAWVCGEPALDRDFGAADLYVLLDMHRLDPRYVRRFLGQ